jgi:hypothetical protein
MSEWITDRLPTLNDVGFDGKVWCMMTGPGGGCVTTCHWECVQPGEPWQPIPKPAPYVKPKRWTVKWNNDGGYWMLTDGVNRLGLRLMRWDNKDAAQRICDIYNEVLP